MPCTQTLKGIAQDCLPSMGGLKDVLIANKEDIQEITEQEGKVSAIVMKEMAKFHRYSFKPATANLVSAWQIDNATGSKYVQSDLTMMFTRMDTPKRIEINALVLTEAVVIAHDNNDAYWLLGKDEPVMATAGGGDTGTARTDRNGYNISLQDNSKEMPLEVNAEIIPDLIG